MEPQTRDALLLISAGLNIYIICMYIFKVDKLKRITHALRVMAKPPQDKTWNIALYYFKYYRMAREGVHQYSNALYKLHVEYQNQGGLLTIGHFMTHFSDDWDSKERLPFPYLRDFITKGKALEKEATDFKRTI